MYKNQKYSEIPEQLSFAAFIGIWPENVYTSNTMSIVPYT